MLVNLTPHSVSFHDEDGNIYLTVPASGQQARVSARSIPMGTIEGVPHYVVEYGRVEGLPVPEDGISYIVSMMVRERVAWRKDVFSPDSGSSARRVNGQIVSVQGLVGN